MLALFSVPVFVLYNSTYTIPIIRFTVPSLGFCFKSLFNKSIDQSINQSINQPTNHAYLYSALSSLNCSNALSKFIN